MKSLVPSLSIAIQRHIWECVVNKSLFYEISLSEWADYTDCSVPTITKFVYDQVKAGLMVASDKRSEIVTKGRRSTLYCLNPDQAYFLGVDMKQHSLSIRIIDTLGECVQEYTNPTIEFSNTPDCMYSLCREVSVFIDKCKIRKDKIFACFNISGRVDPQRGMSYSIFTFEGNEGMPLSSILSNMIGVPVVIENDTRSMLRGELALGRFSEYKNLVYVNFGWGLATAIIIEGKLYSGANGFSGEFGHSYAFDNGIVCHCGRKGCIETEVSGKAAVRILRERLCSTSLNPYGVSKLTDKELLEFFKKMDPLSKSIILEMGQKLGTQLANLMNVLNPDALILGGSFIKNNNALTCAIEESIRMNTLKLLQKNLFIGSGSDSDRIGVIGACFTARDFYFKNKILSMS